jgi:hypothetical protein
VNKRPEVGGSLYVGNKNGVTTPLSSPSGSAFVRGDLYVNGGAHRSGGSTFPVGGDAFIGGALSGNWSIDQTLYQPAGTTTPGGVTATATQEAPIPPILPCPCDNPPLVVRTITDLGANPAFNDNDESYRELPDGSQEATPLDPDIWADPNSGPATLSLPCGRYYFSSIHRTGAATIIAEGRVVIMVGGDMNIGGGITIDTEEDAEIDLFVEGDLTVGGANFGRADKPSLVRVYVGGTSVRVNSAGTFGGNIYAPNATVVMGASGGASTAPCSPTSFLVGAATEVHYDTAIRQAGDVCIVPGARRRRRRRRRRSPMAKPKAQADARRRPRARSRSPKA